MKKCALTFSLLIASSSLCATTLPEQRAIQNHGEINRQEERIQTQDLDKRRLERIEEENREELRRLEQKSEEQRRLQRRLDDQRMTNQHTNPYRQAL